MRLHILLSGFALVSAITVRAQVAPPSGHWEYVRVCSGQHDNPFPIETVVWRDFVAVGNRLPWLRLTFAGVALPEGSYLRIVSLVDGDWQTMHQHHVEQWDSTSAYFNGNVVLVELVAGPRTKGNFVDITKVMAGDHEPEVQEPDSICGTTDKLHLSAGHCFATGQVLQFAVPGSNSNCSLVHPPAAKQFAIDSASSMSVNGGVGNDYWVFKCFANSTTGRTTWQEQATAFTLAASIPANGTTLRNYGFGVDGTTADNATGNSCSCSSSSGTGQRNQTQQTHTGPLNSVSGSRLNYGFDTCGGNSGSVVQHNSTLQVVGIHTHGGCTASGGSNSGTAITHSGLQSAIATMSSGGSVGNDNCTGAIALALGNNGSYSTAAATTSTPAWPCGLGSNDLWFTYNVPCAKTVTFSTCVSGSNFDTVMQVFSGSCTGLTSLGCNDDWSGCSLSTLRSRVVVTTTAATTLRIRVGGYNGARGTFLINVSHTACQ